tara:strand:+ start:1692 stop:2642 length:951 start_codon:yes stop_codon:yes gene_type:complete
MAAKLESNQLELHYFFSDASHDIDAVVRNKCEAELLAIVYESASIFDIDINLTSLPPEDGGFRDVWKALGKNSAQINVLLVAVGVAVTIYFNYSPDDDERKKTLEELQIKELKLRIKALENAKPENTKDLSQALASKLSKSLKITKRRSNFYSQLQNYRKVSEISLAPRFSDSSLAVDEMKISRAEFNRFILSTNKLKVAEDASALIEIVSPVLKDGNYRWKGIYMDKTINFRLTDSKFRDSIFIDGLNFRAGTFIKCVLNIHRELDEIGEIKIKGYSVPTVIEIIDGTKVQKTLQGQAFLQAKTMRDNQSDMFKE